MPLSETDALTLTNSFATLPPDRQKHAATLLHEYKAQQEEKGLPLFPVREQREREKEEMFTSMFTDVRNVDKFAPQIRPHLMSSPDPDKDRKMAANMMFMAKALKQPIDYVRLNYATLLPTFSTKTFGTEASDDNTFYSLAQKHVQKETVARELQQDAMKESLKAVASPSGSNGLGAYVAWREKAKEKDGFNESSHQDFLKAHGYMADKVRPYRKVITEASTRLKGMMTGEGASSKDAMFSEDAGVVQREVVDQILSIPAKDRNIVIAAIMANSEQSGEESDKGFTTETGEAFARMFESALVGGSGREAQMTLEELQDSTAFYTTVEGPVTPENAKAVYEDLFTQQIKDRTLRSTDEIASLAEPAKETRKLTKDEAALVRAEMAKAGAAIQIARQIRNAALTADPVKGAIASAVGSSLAMVPMAAMGPGGLALSAKAYADMEFEQLMLEYPTMKAADGALIAGTAGIAMSALDKLEVDFLKGKLPSVSGLIKKGIAQSALKRGAIRATQGIAFQNAQEAAQDITTPVAQEIIAALKADVPQVDWDAEYSTWAKGRADVFIGTLPLALIGAGGATYADVKGFERMVQNRDSLGRLGITDADADAIIAAGSAGDKQAAQDALRAGFANRSPEVAAKFGAVQQDVDRIEAEKRFEALTRRGAMPKITRSGDKLAVTMPDGTVAEADSWPEARALVEQAFNDTVDNDIEDVAQMADFFVSQQRENMEESVIMDLGTKRDVTDDAAEGLMTEEEARDAQVTAGLALGLTEEQSVAEMGAVFGNNITETREGVVKSASKLFAGADVTTVVEETVEGRFKAGVAQNKYSWVEARNWISMAEEATGQKFLVKDSERGVIEAISSIVVADVVGRRQRGTGATQRGDANIPAGTITRGIISAINRASEPGAASRFGAFLSAFRAYFRQVFQRARAISKAKAEGKLGSDYQKFVDDLMGVDSEVRATNEAATEAMNIAEGQEVTVQQAASTIPVGSVVSYNGYTGRLEQDGERFQVVTPKRTVDLTGDDLAEVVLEGDPRIARDLFNEEIQAAEDQVVEDFGGEADRQQDTERKFQPRYDRLAIERDGTIYTPQHKAISRSVAQVGGKMAFRVRDTRTGKIELLRGAEAQQAIDAVLESAVAAENRGDKVTFSIGKRDSSTSLRVKKTRAELIQATEESSDWKDWYQKHEETLIEFFGADADFFQKILSVTSQAATVKSNVALALKAYVQVKTSAPLEGYLPAVKKNLQRVAEELQIEGQKIAAYQQANTGAEDVVVVDRHISRMLFGVDSPSAKQFKKGQQILTQIANALGWKPRQVQAAMWAASIRKAGKTPESYDSYLRELNRRGTLLERIGSVVPANVRNPGQGGVGGTSVGGSTTSSERRVAQDPPSQITYSIGRRAYADAIQDELARQLDRDPDKRRAFYVEITRRLADASRKTKTVEGLLSKAAKTNASKLTPEEINKQAEKRADARYAELIAALPKPTTPEQRTDAMDRAVAEAEAWKKQAKLDVPDAEDLILANLKVVNAAIMGLPPAMRGTVVPKILPVAMAKNPQAAVTAINNAIEKIGDVVESTLKKEYMGEIKDLLARGQPRNKPGDKPRSDVGPEVARMFAAAKEAAAMDEAMVQSKLAEFDAELADTTNPPTPEREDVLNELVAMYELAGNLEQADAAKLKAVYDSLQMLFTTGFNAWQAERERQRAQEKSMMESLMKDTGITDVEFARNMQSQVGALRNLGRAAILELSSFPEVVHYLFGKDSVIGNRLIDMERRTDNHYQDLNAEMEQGVTDFFTALGGSPIKGQKLRFTLSTKLDVDAGRGLKLTQMQAISAAMMWRQPDGKRHMMGKFDDVGNQVSDWAFDQTRMDDIERQITPEAWKLANFISEQYAAEYPKLNALYREREGVDLPQNPWYWPLSVEPGKAAAGMMIDPVTGLEISSVAMTPGFLNTRSTSAINRPKFNDALQVYLGHTKQLNFWMARYDFAKLMQRLFNNKQMRGYVDGRGGKAATTVLNKWLDIFVQGGIRDSAAGFVVNDGLMRIANRATTAAILGRLSTLLVQTTQLAAASVQIPMTDFVRLQSLMYAGQLNFNAARKSDFIQRRVRQRSPLVQQAMQNLMAAKNPSQLKNSIRMFGKLLADTDGFNTAATYTIIYHYQLEQATAAGIADPEAYAASEAERLTEEVAQPVRQSQRSLLELSNTNPLAKVGWAFASEARQKLILQAWALRHGTKDPARLVKSAFLVFIINGLMVQGMKNAWAEFRGADEDDMERMWSWQNLLINTATAPLTGFPGWQAFSESGTLYSGFMRARGAAKRLVTGETWEDLDEDPVQAMRDVELLLSALAMTGETGAALSIWSHVATDAVRLVDNLDDEE